MVDLSAETDKADTASVLASWLAREAAVPFEPYSTPPVRAMLAQLGDDDHALLVLMHHVSPTHLCCEVLLCSGSLFMDSTGANVQPMPGPAMCLKHLKLACACSHTMITSWQRC